MAKRKRRVRSSARPKGSYPLPTGGYISTNSYRNPRTGRVIRIRGAHRAEPDAKAVAQALVVIVLEQAQAERNKQRPS